MKFKNTASEETTKAEGRDVTFECPECSKRITTKFSEEQIRYLLEGNDANVKCGRCKNSFTIDSSVLGMSKTEKKVIVKYVMLIASVIFFLLSSLMLLSTGSAETILQQITYGIYGMGFALLGVGAQLYALYLKNGGKS